MKSQRVIIDQWKNENVFIPTAVHLLSSCITCDLLDVVTQFVSFHKNIPRRLLKPLKMALKT